MSLLLSQKCYVSKVDNATVSSDADKAECLNSYFASIFTARQHSLLSQRCISYRKSVWPSVWPSVCHMLVSSQNDSSYDSLEDSPM